MDIREIGVYAPSVVGVGEAFSIGIKVLTDPYFAKGECYTSIPSVNGRFNLSPRGMIYMDNVPGEWGGKVEIRGGEGYAGPCGLDFASGTGPYPGDSRPIRRIGGLSYSSPGTRFVSVTDPAGGIKGVSNPIWVTARDPEERLFWGDIHSQTFFSDGLRCPEELYYFARDEAFLDIFAMADHGEMLTDRQWEYFVNVTNDFNSPGRFVTLVGFEWTSHTWGHRNVYYPGDWGPLLRSNDPVEGTLPGLYGEVRRRDGLVIPHHSANVTMGVDWSLGHDPDLERLVEIYSVWGNSERTGSRGNPRPIRVLGGEVEGRHVVDALSMGRRFGFVGGGDIHDGRPGDDLHTYQGGNQLYPSLYRQGIMGVWAHALTRESIFDALRRRRVFATTNVRMMIRFSIDGHPMGSEIRGGKGAEIEAWVTSDVPIRRVDLVSQAGDRCLAETDRREVRILREEDLDQSWYYVRVERADGEMGWASPIWLD